MSRVFLVEPNDKYDLSTAKEFGDITVLVSKRLNPLNLTEVGERIAHALIDASFDKERDYICLTGQAITSAMFLTVASELYDSFKVLLFDARMNQYVTRTFNENLYLFDIAESLS